MPKEEREDHSITPHVVAGDANSQRCQKNLEQGNNKLRCLFNKKVFCFSHAHLILLVLLTSVPKR
jgi:hypothetical protein